MIPEPFDYLKPSTLDDAVAALSGAGDEAKVLAGGQSLVPLLRLRLAAPGLLVDIGGLAALRGVREDGDELVIGALTTHDQVLRSELVRRHAPIVAAATATVGDRQVRHVGTFGGSLAHADPAGDLPAVATALDAVFTVAGPAGRRDVPAAGFFADYLTTALAPDEILVEVRLPKLPGWGYRYEKFQRVAQGWAIVGVAALVRRSNGSVAQARVALTNMGSTPVRARAVERALAGGPATAAAIEEAAGRAADGTTPPSDVTGSAAYRTHLAGVLTRRAVTVAAGL